MYGGFDGDTLGELMSVKKSKTSITPSTDDRYLLYIDMLGFSDLVRKKGHVEKLYRIIDSLNVHEHDAFRTIVFSDTILVYNRLPATTPGNRQYLVMYLCEFAQDLFLRILPLDLHFRAYLRHGQFIHNEMKNVEAFYGKTLVDSYEAEHGIQCCGLFIDNALLSDCDIFQTTPYDMKCQFVHLMQRLDDISADHFTYPVDSIFIAPQGIEWNLAECFLYLRNIHTHMHNTSLSPRIRGKYAATWQMIRARHRRLLDHLEAHDFNANAVSKMNWTKAVKRAREVYLGPEPK